MANPDAGDPDAGDLIAKAVGRFKFLTAELMGLSAADLSTNVVESLVGHSKYPTLMELFLEPFLHEARVSFSGLEASSAAAMDDAPEVFFPDSAGASSSGISDKVTSYNISQFSNESGGLDFRRKLVSVALAHTGKRTLAAYLESEVDDVDAIEKATLQKSHVLDVSENPLRDVDLSIIGELLLRLPGVRVVNLTNTGIAASRISFEALTNLCGSEQHSHVAVILVGCPFGRGPVTKFLRAAPLAMLSNLLFLSSDEFRARKWHTLVTASKDEDERTRAVAGVHAAFHRKFLITLHVDADPSALLRLTVRRSELIYVEQTFTALVQLPVGRTAADVASGVGGGAAVLSFVVRNIGDAPGDRFGNVHVCDESGCKRVPHGDPGLAEWHETRASVKFTSLDRSFPAIVLRRSVRARVSGHASE